MTTDAEHRHLRCEPPVGVTQALARFATGTCPEVGLHTSEVVQALVDTVGVAIAAHGQDGEPILRAWARPDSAPGRATVWTTGETTSPTVAALLNANAAHVLDYDDISPSMPMHPSAVLLPALVAVAEVEGLAPGRLVEGYTTGAATFRALAEILPHEDHYARGWHTTSTVGRLATVAALARLLGLSEDVTRNALGLASTLASGARSNFGSMTKALHAGVAARDAVMAVELAAAGFTSNPGEVEAEGGFLERLGEPGAAPPGNPADTLAERLEYWSASWPGDWGIKRYPACYGTHRALDAALTARARIAGRPVASVDVQVHRTGTAPLRAEPPTDHLQAKFSLEHTVALALVQGSVGLADFVSWSTWSDEVHDLASRVRLVEADLPAVGEAAFTGGFAVLTVHIDDGEVVQERVDVTRGDGRNPMSDEELLVKFQDCCRAGGLDPDTTAQLFQALSALPGQAMTSDLSAVLGRRHHHTGGLT